MSDRLVETLMFTTSRAVFLPVRPWLELGGLEAVGAESELRATSPGADLVPTTLVPTANAGRSPDGTAAIAAVGG